MKYALVNPNWTFHGSIYFGCCEPHLPIEYGYSKALLERAGHEAIIVDGHLNKLSREEIIKQVGAFQPDFTVVTTAPSYLFWRCPPPELRVPQESVRDLSDIGGIMVAVGPHGSTTPASTLRKLGVDVVVQGEFEEILPRLPDGLDNGWRGVSSICFRQGGKIRVEGVPHAADLENLPAVRWPKQILERHFHHHHRFDTVPEGLGAEIESSRGCPHRCSFCAKENFRNAYRKRPLDVVVDELDGLIMHGVEYIYFIDEVFLPDPYLLEVLRERSVKFGVQMRIDLWNREMLELLGRAGCVSIEAGVESISESGRKALDKKCGVSFRELTERLVFAKRHIPFVQANLIATQSDDPGEIKEWREYLRTYGVWANKPVPMFPYPGSPLYRKKWGDPDESAWERAHEFYLGAYAEFSDIQDQQPLPLRDLELGAQQ